MKEIQECRFWRGQLIHHRRYGYRGVIFDVDPSCMADDEWYRGNRSQPTREQPWYHVLVDKAEHTTYVAEENLEDDELGERIQHPLIDELFDTFQDGRYVRAFDA